MKIDPVGIQSYQQVTKRDQQAAPMAPESQERQLAEARVTIEPQREIATSKMAVKAPAGQYAEFLSVDERKALDLLFSRFRDGSRFGPGYSNGSETTATDVHIGRIIDVKV